MQFIITVFKNNKFVVNKQLQSKSHFYAVSMPINDAKSKNSKKINQMIIREVYVFVEVFNT